MKIKKGNETSYKNQFNEKGMDLQELVSIIGYRLTAYIGRTTIQSVAEWLQNGLPETLETRIQLTLEIAKPMAEAESEFVAQEFLSSKLDDLEPYMFPAAMLRDADIQTARTVLMKRVKEGFLNNITSDLEVVADRLKQWIARAEMPPQTAYTCHLWKDRLSLVLVHAGFPLEQQIKWDRGVEWPSWAELIAEVPEMATARTSQDLQTGSPFKYLRRSIK